MTYYPQCRNISVNGVLNVFIFTLNIFKCYTCIVCKASKDHWIDYSNIITFMVNLYMEYFSQYGKVR